MCFNEKVSIITYIFGIIGCINLYFNLNLKIEAIIFAWIIQMQLIEYFLWNNQSCNQINIDVTKVGIIVNHLEPIVLWITILALSTHKLPDYVNILMILFVIVTYLYTKNIFLDKCTLKKNNNLIWEWNRGEYNIIYYLFFIICINLLFLYGVNDGKKLAILITALFLISYIFYRDEKSVGAMWCFFSAFCPWIIPILYKI
jgi:hypothetical protein